MDDIKNANKSRGLGWFDNSSSESEKSFQEIVIEEDKVEVDVEEEQQTPEKEEIVVEEEDLEQVQEQE